jgi:hypothetical protein
MSDIEQINRSHSGLKNLMIENFVMAEGLDETQIKNRLRGRGWSSNEIEFYPEFTRYALLLTTESLSMAYSVLTYRYSSLLLKYDIRNNAKTILNKIILDALDYHISTTGDSQIIEKLYYTKDNDDARIRIILDKLLSSIEAIEEHNPYLNRFSDKQGADLLVSICSMLEAPKNVVEDCISKFNSTLKVFEDWMLGGAEPHFVNKIMVKDAYKETRRKSQRMLFILSEMLKRS